MTRFYYVQKALSQICALTEKTWRYVANEKIELRRDHESEQTKFQTSFFLEDVFVRFCQKAILVAQLFHCMCATSV